MKEENILLINDSLQSDQGKQSLAESVESRHRIDNVARRFKFQCRMVLMLFMFATVVSICLAVMFIVVIGNKNDKVEDQ
jgi:hypothetical protein